MTTDPFAELGRARKHRWVYGIVAVVVLGAGGFAWFKTRARSAPQRYITARVSRGEISEVVETSGTVQPMVQVQVGSQVSGRLARVLVDFNHRVREGQVLAEIDPTPFRAAVAQARASVQSSEAQLVRARVNARVTQLNLDRALDLRQRGLNAAADVDAARGPRDVTQAEIAVATAEIARARASLESATTNLANTRIVAPIAGMVIQRNVDEGQTVAASLQAPVLFLLANDLTRMRIIANVDEADISRLREHMVATARVDAFQGRTFRGEVTELRFGSVVTAGVVTYPAVITVANPNLELRPGMTATINVVSARHESVLRVPNAALRFVPSTSGDAPQRPATDPSRSADDGVRRGTLYVLRDGRPRPLRVVLGISEESLTEVSSAGLAVGAEVITDEAEPESSQRSGGGSPGMSGGRGRRM